MAKPPHDPISLADHTMRYWQGPEPGQVAIGSKAHKRLFCLMLLETHNPYRPAVIQWPRLEGDALRRLTSLPIWDIAVQTEGRAAVRVKAFAQTVTDPLLREAMEMGAGEEARHKVVLSKLVEAYGIRLAPEPGYAVPRFTEWAWLVTGYSECIDSFLAFGLFAHARRSGYFPPELVETFEPVMQEEARHILFLVNWSAWHRRNLRWWQRPIFAAKLAAVAVFLVWERIGIARGLDAKGEFQDANFAMTGGNAVGAQIEIGELLELCLKENDIRMQGYDRRLIRPRVMPAMARFVLHLMRKLRRGTEGRRSEARH
jgi:hypothetical protein